MQKKTRAPTAGPLKRPMRGHIASKMAAKMIVKSGAAPRGQSGLPAAMLRIRQLQAQLRDARARIKELRASAETDFLLDILNRRGFARELTRAAAFTSRYAASAALIVIDVDRLKPINDAFGHAAGDAVLKAVVGVIRRHVRASDVIARLGGDEFAVLLWQAGEADARIKAEVLEAAVDRLTFVFRNINVTAGASTGVAMLGPGIDGGAALEQADRAMYARKAARRTQT